MVTYLSTVGLAHLKAYTSEAAANQRYLISSGAYSFQQIVDIIRANFPELLSTTPKGNTGEPLPPVYALDTSKAAKEIGMTHYRTLEQTIVDTVKSLLETKKSLA
jgi:nucleoside-diphosphate-sugar epimerase